MAIYSVQSIAKVQITQINGDLRIRGYSGNDLILDAEGPHLEQLNERGLMIISTDGDCDLKVPDHLLLEIQQLNGDAKITNLIAALSISEVNGDLAIRHIEAPVQLGRVHGDLSIKHVADTVQVESVDGDCSIQRIDGDVLVAMVSGDIALGDINGSIHIPESMADIAIEVDFVPAYRYHFKTNDDIVFTLPPNPSVAFHLPEGTDYTFTRELKQAATISTVEEAASNIIRIVFGDGAALVTVDDVDDVVFTSQNSSGFGVSFDFNLGDQLKDIEMQINESLSGLGQMIEAQTREALASATDFAKDLRVEARIQRAKERAERRVERHAERAERMAGRTQRYADRAQRFETRRPGPAPAPPSPVSSEERMLILQMLQDGKISVEEANKLLNTLEGKA